MPKYRLSGPDGDTLLIEADRPPTQADAEDIFKARTRTATSRPGMGDAKVADIDYDRPAPPEGGAHEEDSDPGRPAMGDLRASEADQPPKPKPFDPSSIKLDAYQKAYQQSRMASPERVGEGDFTASIASSPAVKGLAQGLEKTGYVLTHPIQTVMGLPYEIDRAIGLVPQDSANPLLQPVLTPDHIKKIQDALLSGYEPEGETGKVLAETSREFASSMTSPGMAAMVVGGSVPAIARAVGLSKVAPITSEAVAEGTAGKVIGRGFQTEMIGTLPEAINHYLEAKNDGDQHEIAKAALGVAANVGFPMLIEKHLAPDSTSKIAPATGKALNMPEGVRGVLTAEDRVRLGLAGPEALPPRQPSPAAPESVLSPAERERLGLVAPLTANALAEVPKPGAKAEPVTKQADLDKTVAEETKPDATPKVTEQSAAGPESTAERPTEPAAEPADQPKKGPDALQPKTETPVRDVQQPAEPKEGTGEVPANKPGEEAGARSNEVEREKEVTPETLADQAGVTFRGEQKPQVPGMKGYWQFNLKGEHEEFTFNVPVGSSAEEIAAARDSKLKQVAPQLPQGFPPHPELPEKGQGGKDIFKTFSEADVEKLLELPPPTDTAEPRARVQAFERQNLELRDKLKELAKQQNEIDKRVLRTTGPKYMRGRVKTSAKAGDIKQRNEIIKQIHEIQRQLSAIDDLTKGDRQLMDRTADVSIIRDKSKPLLRRLDRMVRMQEDLRQSGGPGPSDELVKARDAETARGIREKYPDATDAEIEKMKNELSRNQYFSDNPWQEPNTIPTPPDLRRAALKAEYSEKGHPTHQFPPELVGRVQRYLKDIRQHGEKPSPLDPVEDLSATELESLKKDIQAASKKAVEDNAAEEKRKAAEAEAEKEKEAKLLSEAQAVADSAPKPGSGKPGARTAKQVRDDLVERIGKAIDETLAQSPATLTDRGDGTFVADAENGHTAFGEIEPTDSGFKVSAWRAGGESTTKVTANVKTQQEAEWVIRAMAASGKGRSVVAVPGDGVYRLHRYGPTLLKTWADARRIDTSAGRKPGVETSNVSKAQGKDYLREAREFATAIEHNGGYYTKRGDSWWQIQQPDVRTFDSDGHAQWTTPEDRKVADQPTIDALENGGVAPKVKPEDVKEPLEPPAPEIKGMGGAVPGEFEGGGTATSNKNAVVDAERAQRGLPPMMKALKHTWGQAWDEAMARIDADPEYQDKLVAELQRKPRTLTDTENAALLHRRVELRNGYDKSTRDAANGYDDAEHATSDEARDSAKARMMEARTQTAYYSDKLQELESATKSAGSESGRSLAARKMMANEDYTLAKMELEARAARGGRPLTDGERAEIVDLQKKITDTQKAYDDYRTEADRKIAEAEAKTTHAEQLRKALEDKAPHPSILRVAERIVGELDTRADAARKRIKERMGRTTAGVDPTVLLDVAEIGASHLAHKILDFAKWSEKMIQDVGDWVKPHLQTVWDMSQKHLDDFADSKAPKAAASDVKKILRTDPPEVQQEALTERIADKVKKGKKDEIAWYVQKLARTFIMQGVDKLPDLIDALHDRLVKVLPDLTKREVMDMYSGYGDYKQLSSDQISVKMRDLKGQAQQIGKLEDMQAGKAPLKTGVERRSPSDEERRLIAQVNEAKKKGGFVVTDPARQLSTALQARKTYYQNRIKDLQTEIATRKKIVGQKAPVPTDAALERMKAEYERLKEQHEQIFAKPGLTDAQRVERAIKGLEDDIKEYEKRVANKDISPMKQPSSTPSTPALEAVRARRDALRAQLDELRALAKPRLTPDQLANKALKTRLTNQILDYADRLAREDYSRRQRRALPLDSEATRLKAENERLKKQYQEGLIKARLAERRGSEKGFDIVSKLRRFAVLSGVKVLGKLGAYSATKMGTIGATEGVSAVISRIPKISEIAKKAPSEGGPSLRIVTRAAAKAFTSGVMDAFQTATRGKSDLREAYSTRPAIPRDWLDFFQTVHEVIKSPLRRMAFEVSYAKRMAHAVEMGVVDTNDLSVQMAIGKDAYVDSDRALLLENNRLASGIRNLFRRLEDKDRGTGRVPLVGKAMATLGRVETPILTVPFNYAKQTLESAFGLVTGGIRAREAFKAGIENLSAEEADNIMRHLKYGTIGGAMLLYGFYDGWNNGDNGVFGGYYQPGQKRKETQAGVGGIKIGGHKISGLLLHNPVLAVGQLGHTIGAVAQQKFTKHDKQTKGLTVGLAAGAFGLISDSPIGREAEFVEHMSDPRALPYAMGEHLKGVFVPQIVQEAAEWMDRDKYGNLKKRKPKTIMEHVQSGVPIWRESLPERKK